MDARSAKAVAVANAVPRHRMPDLLCLLGIDIVREL
jgi:hypothetical protein